ncbi:T9SS C-terminal target domain-containing protein [Marinilabiliaceae bacterium JC017]|nr:T9SS C-terminal target domain-containing protein [Marinilabiliaceae bacterium JC017]
MKQIYILCTFLKICCLCFSQTDIQYASKLIKYVPAPGQFINKSPGLPANAQKIIGKLDPGDMVSLGFWGGYVVVGFDTPIKNDPKHPYGVDFTVFGNPFLGSSEPGIVMVMQDKNGNGKPDETWYELQGSDHWLSTTKKNYTITYTNPHGKYNVPYVDSDGKRGEVTYMPYHGQEHYPLSTNFPDINQTSYSFTGTKLKSKTNHGTIWVNYEFDYGYADNKPINRRIPFDQPDNPYTLYELEGCGGDAFDISWAMDNKGNPVELDQIDFIKIYNGVTQNAGAIGEVSCEVACIAAVKPNSHITGVTDMIISNHPPVIGQQPAKREFEWPQGLPFPFEAYVISKGKKNANQSIIWETDNSSIATISSEGVLHPKAQGTVTITAKWQKNRAIRREFKIIITPATANEEPQQFQDLRLWPNPARNRFYIKSPHDRITKVCIYNLSGQKEAEQHYDEAEKVTIELNGLTTGIYLIEIQSQNKTIVKRLIVQ